MYDNMVELVLIVIMYLVVRTVITTYIINKVKR